MIREGNLKSGSVGSVGSAGLLPGVDDFYSRLPETYLLESWYKPTARVTSCVRGWPTTEQQTLAFRG
jgi:hypothetical protein